MPETSQEISCDVEITLKSREVPLLERELPNLGFQKRIITDDFAKVADGGIGVFSTGEIPEEEVEIGTDFDTFAGIDLFIPEDTDSDKAEELCEELGSDVHKALENLDLSFVWDGERKDSLGL